MRIKLSIVTALFLSLFLQQSALATPQVQTSLSDNSVFLGDLFILTISIDDSGSDFQLDSKPLEKEFNVSRPSRSSSTTYIDGKFSEQTQWQITLQAKRTGELTIPALKIGSLRSAPLKISVKKPSQQATQAADNLIFMENSLNKNSVYLEQPLIFTSKIYIAQNSSELELLAPTLKDATVTVYGEDKNGETIRNGIRYKTITRQYKISATKAGKFTINSPLLTGNLRKVVNISEWQNRVISKPINIRGDSLNVEIKAKPVNYQGEWLISEDVRLFEDSTFNQQSYHVGEPITRSITLQVASVEKNKLPTIDFNYPKNWRFYPDQDELKEGEGNGFSYAQRTIRHAIIADQPGELSLPEIKLAWWNSQTDKQEFAVLPAQTLTILPAEKQAANAATNNSAAALTDKNLPATTVSVVSDALIYWQIATAILFLALVILIFYHLSYRRSQGTHKDKNKKNTQPLNQAYLSLQEALHKQQASLTYQALLNYAQSEFPLLKSLAQLPEQLNLEPQDKTALTAQIKTLENACATPSPTWDSRQLSKLMKKHEQKKGITVSHNIMDLNPS